jgi:hypothetical protein
MSIIRKDEKIKNIGKELANIGVDKGYGTFQYISAGSNCKLCHIDDIANAVGDNLNNIPIFAKRLNELFEKNKKLCFTVNVVSEEYINELNKHFRLLYAKKVPIGYYGSGYITYFGLFLTNNDFNSCGITAGHVIEKKEELKNEIDEYNPECQFDKYN